MYVSYIWKIFPMFFIEKSHDDIVENTKNRFMFVSTVDDLNDPVQIEHEKIMMKINYIITLITLLVTIMAYAVSPYLFLIMAGIYAVIMGVLYFTDFGRYYRDMMAYRQTLSLYSIFNHIAYDEAVEHYVTKIMTSSRYDSYTTYLGKENVIKDLTKKR